MCNAGEECLSDETVQGWSAASAQVASVDGAWRALAPVHGTRRMALTSFVRTLMLEQLHMGKFRLDQGQLTNDMEHQVSGSCDPD